MTLTEVQLSTMCAEIGTMNANACLTIRVYRVVSAHVQNALRARIVFRPTAKRVVCADSPHLVTIYLPRRFYLSPTYRIPVSTKSTISSGRVCLELQRTPSPINLYSTRGEQKKK